MYTAYVFDFRKEWIQHDPVTAPQEGRIWAMFVPWPGYISSYSLGKLGFSFRLVWN